MVWFRLLVLFAIIVQMDAAFCGDPDPSFPEISEGTEMITCYLSVTSLADEPFHGVDLLPIRAPVNASVTQIMMLAETYSAEIWFESHYDQNYGTYISGINGLSNNDPWYWFLYDKIQGGASYCGTDYTRAGQHDHFHWQYEEYIPQY